MAAVVEMQLRPLEPESWGDRLQRAREAARLSTRDVAAALRPWVTRHVVSYMEMRGDAPTRSLDRSRALMMLVFYGVDPTDFELSIDRDGGGSGIDLTHYWHLGAAYRDELEKGATPAAALAVASSRCTALPAAA